MFGKRLKPLWKDSQNGKPYYPSYNVCPGSMTPILFDKKHIVANENDPTSESCDDKVESELVVMPMQWGLVPSWHAGADAKSVAYKMTNARSDGILTKRSFKTPLEKGRRCVVVVDGYYEWQTGADGSKQPYFIYQPVVDQPAPQKQEYVESVSVDDVTAELGCNTKARRLLMMAGLFDVWQPKSEAHPLYSYSIITVDAHKDVSWIHHRMPAILSDEAEVSAWLDYQEVSLSKAVTSLIRPRNCLRMFPVARTAVGNVHNKSDECIKPVDLNKEKGKTSGSNFMQKWLEKSQKDKSTKNKLSKDTLSNDTSPPKTDCKLYTKRPVSSDTGYDATERKIKTLKTEHTASSECDDV